MIETLVADMKLKANISKCDILVMGAPENNVEHVIHWQGIMTDEFKIPTPDSYTYLGLEISKHFKRGRFCFEAQCDKVERKFNSAYYRLFYVIHDMRISPYQKKCNL